MSQYEDKYTELKLSINKEIISKQKCSWCNKTLIKDSIEYKNKCLVCIPCFHKRKDIQFIVDFIELVNVHTEVLKETGAYEKLIDFYYEIIG